MTPKPTAFIAFRIVPVILAVLFFNPGMGLAAPAEITVYYKGRPQTVTYDTYIPKTAGDEPLSVLICVGGLPSGPDECFSPQWYKFADENKIMILGVGFVFVDEDWPKNASYQYAQVWSGQAVLKILNILAKDYNINQKELYCFGISAGAQFSIRFAQKYPHRVRAVAAHAAGGYDRPRKYIRTKFLLTVGELDNTDITRLGFAKRFTKWCRAKKIDIELRVIPGIHHIQTEEQNEMSRRFFERARKLST